KIRRRLGAEGLSLSDRRYKESLTIIRAKAWLQGRAYAVEDDLAVLSNILWDDPASEPMVRGFVLDVANPQEKRAREIADALQVALKDLGFDLFCSFYKYFVKLLPADQVIEECRGHRDLLDRALGLREHEKLRAWTRLKSAETALATELVLDLLLKEPTAEPETARGQTPETGTPPDESTVEEAS